MSKEFDEKAAEKYIDNYIDMGHFRNPVEARPYLLDGFFHGSRWQLNQCQAEAATLHLAYEARIDEVIQERDKLLAELKEQCRINGIGQERELALMTENKRLIHALRIAQPYVAISVPSTLYAEKNIDKNNMIIYQALAIGDKVGE